jgi:hypothetical protein
VKNKDLIAVTGEAEDEGDEEELEEGWDSVVANM